MMETPKQDAPVYDAQGNVRPTDARYAGTDRVKYTAQELADIREAEIQANTEIIAKQQAEIQEQNDKRLNEATNGVLPSSQRTNAAADDDGDAGDQYDAMEFRELQEAAKARDGMSATGSADELRARLRDDDTAKQS